MTAALGDAGNPGRGGYGLAMRAADLVYEARETLAELFAISDPLRICFTSGATEALNLAIKGMLRPGDHAVCSATEHNAVWRPLKKLETQGVSLSLAQSGSDGIVPPQAVAEALRPETRLIVLTHASNVNGALNDIAAVGKMARTRGIPFLVDAAQTAGCVAIDVEAMEIDLLAFPGHKGLLGPMGVGGLYVRRGIVLETLIEGGTGSESENCMMPDFLPDRFESGTPNLPGIAGLRAGAAHVLGLGVGTLAQREHALSAHLVGGLEALDRVRVYGPAATGARVGVVSFTIEGGDGEDVAAALMREFSVACRAGLHCAPLAHLSQGTGKCGTIRFSLGWNTTEGDIDTAIEAVAALAMKGIRHGR